MWFLVSYLFWGMSFSTLITPNSIVKKRGWFFPCFRSEYHELKAIQLKTAYIYQHGYGAHSHHALYVGVTHGPFDKFVDLSWGVRKTENGEGYLEFVNRLQTLTRLPVQVDEEFKLKFKQKYATEFSYKP